MNYKEFKQLVSKYHISEEDVYQIAQYFADEKLKRKFVDTQIKDLYDKMNIQDCDISIESFDVKPNTLTDILALKYLKIQGEKGWEGVESIPLTPEWLLKSGLEKSEPYIKYGNGADWQPEYPRSTFTAYSLEVREGTYFAVVYEVNEWRNKNGEIESDISVRIVFGDFYPTQIDSSDFIYCQIPDFVHQLQNLYFALTGEELKTKVVE
jgi:hypothetical protein